MKHPHLLLPKKFLEKLPNIVPADQYEQVLHAFSLKKPTTFRINTLKQKPETFHSLINQLPVSIQPFSGIPNAFILNSPTLRELSETELYKNGLIYVQSLSSMIPPLVLDPKPGDKLLDIAAAPGSKSTQMAAIMGNSGEIVANDNSPIRLEKLKANLRIQGVTNVTVRKSHAETIWQDYPEYFDKALVDVPCSMEGRFYTEDPKSYDHWTPRKVKELAERQKFMLRAAISATKPRGTIVYSTCTLSPEENEGVIDWILKKEKGAIELLDITLSQIPTTPPLSSWNGRIYNPEVTKTVRILPSPLFEAFYIAKLRKAHSNIPKLLLSKP